jgi:predicted short-subunit dehydrogenase-like oxidoreductase (DUF2520 family)
VLTPDARCLSGRKPSSPAHTSPCFKPLLFEPQIRLQAPESGRVYNLAMNQPPSDRRDVPAALSGKTVAVLGAGKVGTAVTTLLTAVGMRVVAVTTRSAQTGRAAEERTGVPASTDNAAAARQADIVLITTNDDSIGPVAAEVAQAGGFGRGQLVVHMSGVLPLSVLSPAEEAGALVGGAHPLQSFATVEDAARGMEGSVFGITVGAGAAREPLEALVVLLGGTFVEIADSDKALYHAAAVVASNYLVAVEDTAVALLVEAGFDEASALRALQPLIRGTVANIERHGTTKALTGPIVRGDAETVRNHIEALAGLPGDELRVYRILGLRTLAIAERRATLDAGTVRRLREVLRGED